MSEVLLGQRHALLLRIAYDGAPFSGLAVQQNAITVGGVLTEAVRQMDPGASALRVASRTDAGVHALEQYVAFDTDTQIAARGWLLGLTGLLPPEIAVTRVSRMPLGFNPSKAAERKIYRYLILRGTIRDPFLEKRAWRVFETLDVERMKAEASALVGVHDFAAYRSSNDFRRHTERHIHRAEVVQPVENPRLLAVEVEGNRFLHNMVRIIVGTLVDVGRGKRQLGVFQRAFASLDRLDLGMTAPAAGLYLAQLLLRESGQDPWP